MHRKALSAVAIALLLAAGAGSAVAQRFQDNDRRGNDRNYRNQQSQQMSRDEWRQGGRIPNEYRHRQYVVSDWRGHQLRQPPRGYHWVQHGNDYVLAAIATGVIAQILANH